VARGARRIRSKLGGHVEPLTRVLLSLNQGRTLDVVGQGQTLESHRHLRDDLELMAAAIYLAEIVEAFTSDANPNPALYGLLERALGWLGTLGNSEVLVRFFEFHVLNLSGYLPELERCVECQRELKQGGHRYYPAGGGALCLECHPTQGAILPLSVDALKVLRFLRSHDYEEAARLNLSSELTEELQRLLGASIHHILERDVRAAAFLGQVQGLSLGAPASM
jgi:DNA repair protein RecO (recombination protein O)